MKTYNVLILIGLLSLTGCKSTETVNETVTSIVDVADEREGHDLVRVTTESGYSVIVDRAILDSLNGVIPVADTEPSAALQTGQTLIGMAPIIGETAKGIFGAALTGLYWFERKRKNAEIAARLRGEGELKKSKLITMALASGIEFINDPAVKQEVSKRLPNELIKTFDEITAGIRNPSNK
jgi:hypothetical protein